MPGRSSSARALRRAVNFGGSRDTELSDDAGRRAAHRSSCAGRAHRAAADVVGRARAGLRPRRRRDLRRAARRRCRGARPRCSATTSTCPRTGSASGVRTDSHPLFRQTDLHLRSRFHVQFTGVAAILYRDGHDFQGLHSDREMRWLDDTVIAIAVLGARRPFVLRPRLERGVPVERIPAGNWRRRRGPDAGRGRPARHGRRVPARVAARRARGAGGRSTPRISLTWRWTSRTGRPDTNPTYYEGRQFSDRPRQAGSRTRRP